MSIFHDVPKNRLVPDLHHRLWPHVRFFANTCAATTREENYFHNVLLELLKRQGRRFLGTAAGLGWMLPPSAAGEWRADPTRTPPIYRADEGRWTRFCV